VFPHVLALSHYPKIAYVVVPRVPVDMVNDFSASQWSAENFSFSNHSMFVARIALSVSPDASAAVALLGPALLPSDGVFCDTTIELNSATR
jgi:hypothetical protein